MRSKSILVLLSMLFAAGYARAGTWTTLNMPGLNNLSSLSLTGIGDSKIVGSYTYNSDYQCYHGLLYNMLTGAWNTIDKPGAGALGTEIRDIDSDNIVGSYYDTRWHGFIYNLTTQNWTTIDVPGNSSMQPYGIDGDNVVGYYWDGSIWHGFIYSMTTGIYTTLDGLGPHTYIRGISGEKIVGYYNVGGWHGFIYDMTTQTWSTLDAPGASDTIVKGIDGDDIVGHYNGSRSFLYNIATQTWASIYTEEDSDNIFPNNIDSDNVIFDIGQYGSVYTISGPPPVASLKLLEVDGDILEKPMVGGNIIFDASGSYDPDGEILNYEWNFGDGTTPAPLTNPKYPHLYESPGKYTVTLTVTDNDGLTGSTSKELDLSLEKGDILVCRDDMSFVPGKEWTHAGMYIGNEQVVEAVRGRGVIISPLSEWSWTGHQGKYKTYVRALRVKTDDSMGEKAVNFAVGKKGQPFSASKIFLQVLCLTKKQVDSDSWYCSELVWAAYQHASNGAIDLDQNRNGNAVAPDEIDDDNEVEIIGEHKEEKPETIWCWDRLWGGVAYSPVDLKITDPHGLVLNKQGSQIPEAVYQELDIDGDGALDDFFAIPEPKEGDYLIHLIPEPSASPTDTYSLEVAANGVVVTLAEDVQVNNIPAQPYIVRSTESEITHVIRVTIDFDPDTLNLKSKGEWITVYVELPVGHGYAVGDIDVESILLEGLLEVQHSDVQGDVLMVKFDRQDVIAYIELVLEIELPADVTLMVTGELTDGTPFEGSDTIRVIDEGKNKESKGMNKKSKGKNKK